ncbi:MAG TPA: hypothetical protein VL123_05915 [Candidatus Udaeobacter sp.]|jgi:hypothetical protein|nr:hypothetical protein [Candidatus Udaeobacter sp.]
MIRKLVMAALVASIALYAVPAGAHDMSKMGKMPAKDSKMQSVTGEVVDTGCYMAHEAKGEKHVDCATKCINNGMPMGLLTSSGTLYLVTLDHENPDPYKKLKGMAGKTVTVSGTMMERSGMKGIEATEVKAVAVAAK